MPRYATSVRFLVKEGEADTFIEEVKGIQNVGEMQCVWAKTGDLSFLVINIFESEQALLDARPKMIKNLDKCRKYLQEISPELGVTDPVSGPIFCEW